jgi:hypothetical protein
MTTTRLSDQDQVTVTLIDTKTGLRKVKTYANAFWWAEGNGSCDCNRMTEFLTDEECERLDDENLCSRNRFLVIDVSGPGCRDYKDLRAYNKGYPKELLDEYFPI